MPAPSASRCSSSFEGERLAARAPRHVRRVGLRRRHPDGRDDRVGERPHGADQPARHRPRRRTESLDSAGENSLTSIGAPRRTRLRMSESEKEGGGARHLPARAGRPGAGAAAHRHDLRRPARPDRVRGARLRPGRGRRSRKLGPDPLLDDEPEAEERFTSVVRRKPTPIGLLLMDQTVVAGIGNVYRAELLFRARQNPHTPGRLVPRGARARPLARLGEPARASASRPAR